MEKKNFEIDVKFLIEKLNDTEHTNDEEISDKVIERIEHTILKFPFVPSIGMKIDIQAFRGEFGLSDEDFNRIQDYGCIFEIQEIVIYPTFVWLTINGGGNWN